MTYDPTIYLGAAEYYLRGRPPYSRHLASTLAEEAGLDGTGRLLDVGCGPGILTLELAGLFEEAVGLEPDPNMLAEAVRRAGAAGVRNVQWVRGLAEEIPDLGLGTFRLVTFGQSFHWTDRQRVAEAVYDILEPGGALAIINHAWKDRPMPPNPGYPPIPHEAIRATIDRYLGSQRRAGQGFSNWSTEPHQEALARTRFGPARAIYCEGRADIVQDADGVLANYYSTSFAAPHLFGDRLAEFEADVRAELAAVSPTGLFWDWPGDTEILLARRPGNRDT